MNIRFCFYQGCIVLGISMFLNGCVDIQKSVKQENYPSDVDQYQFLRYSGGQEVISPDQVVHADNNWEILLSCLEGKTEDELQKMGVHSTESQLLLLRAMRFIDYENASKDTKIKTKLPILGFEEKQSLIQRVRKLAEEIEPALRNDIEMLKKTLIKKGHGDHAFSVLFSCVVDGIVWFPFRAQGFVREFTLSEERPLFDGVYWAYYPKRNFRCGTNIALGNDIFVVLNWSDGPMEKIQKVFNWTNLRAVHSELVQHGRIVNDSLKMQLEDYEIIDKKGEMTVPVIAMKMNDPLFTICQSMAFKIVQFMGEKMDLENLQDEYGFADRESAFVMVYHEWMWEFMEYLNEKGIIKKPLAFEKAEEAGPKDIGKLLFIVKGSIPE